MVKREKETISAIIEAEREAGFLYYPGGTKAALHKAGVKTPADVQRIMASARERSLKKYRSFAINAAKDFAYGEAVLNALNTASSENSIAKIMAQARHAMG